MKKNSKNEIRVSVILFTYNHEKWISQAIDSILMQKTNFDFEIIILEDYSTDKTREIVIDYQNKYPDIIRLMLSEYNMCDNTNTIKALESSSAEYISFLDGDDYWTSPDKLQKQADFLDCNPDHSICFHNVKMLYETNDIDQIGENHNPQNQKQTTILNDLWKANYIKTCAAMLRADKIKDKTNWLNRLEYTDWAIFIMASLRGYIGYMNEVMAVWRLHKDGYWSKLNKEKQYETMIKFYNDLQSIQGIRYKRQIAKVKSFYLHKLAACYKKRADYKLAIKTVVESFLTYPFNNDIPIRTRIYLLRSSLKYLSNAHYKQAREYKKEGEIDKARSSIKESIFTYPFYRLGKRLNFYKSLNKS